MVMRSWCHPSWRRSSRRLPGRCRAGAAHRGGLRIVFPRRRNGGAEAQVAGDGLVEDQEAAPQRQPVVVLVQQERLRARRVGEHALTDMRRMLGVLRADALWALSEHMVGEKF